MLDRAHNYIMCFDSYTEHIKRYVLGNILLPLRPEHIFYVLGRALNAFSALASSSAHLRGQNLKNLWLPTDKNSL